MNKRLEVYLDADWRSHETRDEFVATGCFFARTSQRADLQTVMKVCAALRQRRGSMLSGTGAALF